MKRIIKHFVRVAKSYAVRINCKHQATHKASCPFTGYTYETCDHCMKYVSIVETKNGK